MRGYKEEGTTTTPFDMTVLNDLDRFHLAGDVIDRVPQLGARAAYAKQAMRDKLIEHKQYIARTARTCRRSATGNGRTESLSPPDCRWRIPRCDLLYCCCPGAALFVCLPSLWADDKEVPEGFEKLFNGKDLKGWQVNEGGQLDKWGAADGLLFTRGAAAAG